MNRSDYSIWGRKEMPQMDRPSDSYVYEEKKGGGDRSQDLA